jgi:hypothetical protein
MKKFLIFMLIFLNSCDSHVVPVKKSRTEICHEYGSKYYEQTKHFEVFQSMDECVESGGRLPKRK